MLVSFAILLVFQCLGEGISFALGLPVPGPVIGMLLLFCTLAASPKLLEQLEQTGNELLRHLSLLFVPAGVGIVTSVASITGHWLAVVVSVVVSTVLTLVVTAAVTQACMSPERKRQQQEKRDA